jgi:hypothetical protein
MKAWKWRDYLEEQSRVHGKNIFTITELANIAHTSRHTLNVELARLRKHGIIEQYARGIYGLSNTATPEDLVRSLDSRAYITSISALYFHQLITQVPRTFDCFTNRRHNRSRVRLTPLGRYVFVCVSKPIYHPPKGSTVASPEQALFDFVYLMRRKGVDYKTIVTFRNLNRLRKSRMATTSRRYPQTVRNQVWNMMADMKKTG